MIEVVLSKASFQAAIPLLGVLVYFLLAWNKASASFDAPLEGVEGDKAKGKHAVAADFSKTITQSYSKYRDSFFKVKETHGETIIVPPKYADELKALPNHILSFNEATDEKMFGTDTLLTIDPARNHDQVFIKSVNQNLTRSLSVLMETIHEECAAAFEEHIGACEDWTEVNIFSKLVTIVALISGRVFIGPEVNRDPEYMRCIIQYTMEVFTAVGVMHSMNPIMRRIYVKFGWIPELQKVHSSFATMQKLMKPVIAERAAAIAAGEPPNDMLTWNMMNSAENVRNSVRIQAQTQLVASMAAIHTTSMTGTHAIYDLAAHPEHAEVLRKELEAVMAEESTPWLTKSSTPKLKLLDSFCKESQRMSPLGIVTFTRKVKKPITLHDGVVLPAGAYIAIPSGEVIKDPKYYTDPETFNPWRFAKLREQPGQESRHQFVSTSPEFMNFGYGTHACPGRFFANNELKVIMSYILTHYDIKWPDGQGRPANFSSSGGTAPDPTKSILMRKRRV